MYFIRKSIITIGILTAATFANAENSIVSKTAPPQPILQSQSVSSKININTASLKDFIKVKGLSKTRAKNIIAYHQKHGDFKTLDDLKLVKGFKKMKATLLKSIQDQLTI